MEPKGRKVQGKLKECIDNITPESIEKAKVALALESEGISPRPKLKDRIPIFHSMIKSVIAAVAQASIECKPKDRKDDKDWYKPFENVVEALKYAEYRIIM